MNNLKDKNLVSILIPVYNRENLISKTIESAINQSYEDIEVIIVDNKSTDNTFEICKKYEKNFPNIIKVFQNNKNLGPVRNWKECLRYSKGNYIKFLYSDDQIDKDFIKRTLNFLIKDNNIAFVFTRVKIYGDLYRDYIFGETGKYASKEFIRGHLLENKIIPVSPSCALFRKKDVEKNLLMNIPNPKNLDFSKYGAGIDLLLFMFTLREYNFFYYINEPLSFFKAHQGSLSISNNLKEYYDFSKYYYIYKTDFIF